MADITIRSTTRFQGRFRVPGDKSISHRALIMGALGEGDSEVSGLLRSDDVQSTRKVLEALGVRFTDKRESLVIHGRGLAGFKSPSHELDCGNSGTTMRLMMGILSGSNLTATLVGDVSLSARPMDRVSVPLSLMGAQIELRDGKFAPVRVRGAALKGISYELPVASAQVKSALLLAGLFAEGNLELTGKTLSRDHTERMFKRAGVSLESHGHALKMKCGQRLRSLAISVPGDPSSAAYFMAAAALTMGSDVLIEDVGLNESRLGFLHTLKKMGADLEVLLRSEDPEPRGDIRVRGTRLLSGVVIEPSLIASMIDELPLLAVVAATARGVTSVRGAGELRVKESDRIAVLAKNLRAMGGKIETVADGFDIEGVDRLSGAEIETALDHRIAMAFAVAGLRAKGDTSIKESDCVAVSFPDFFNDLERGAYA